METYHGHVRTPADAIILFEACRLGLLPRVQRRLSEKERQNIKSGSVFVWDEREAGMRRWTDGKSWSASRVSGSFLTYREMEGKRGGGNVFAPPTMSRGGKSPNLDGSDSDGMDGDGPDGYRYKPDGLMKQSFSITTATHQKLHLISYYARSHPSSQNLIQPSHDNALKHIRPVKGMYPESTVHEQQNVPVVTRAPMITPMPHHSPMHGFARQGATHPANYTQVPNSYGWPPSPIATPPTGIQVPHYGLQHALPPPPPGNSGTSSPMSYSAPPFQSASLGQPSGGSPRLYDNRPSLPHLEGMPAMHRGSVGSPVMSIQNIQNKSPGSTPAQRSTPPVALPPPNPSQNAPQQYKVAPDERYASPANSVQSKSPPRDGAAWEVTPLRSSPSSSMEVDATRLGLDVQDIPTEKLGFGEDTRALRVLDRAFAA